MRSEEKYGGSVNLSLHEVVPQVRLGAFGSGHYENRGRHDKDRIVAAGGFSVKPKAAGKLLWLAAVPEVSASTEVTFSRLQGFYSAATDAKASWDIQLPYIKLGVWVAVELKHTTR